MSSEISFEELHKSDLVVDGVYKGGNNSKSGVGNDPLTKLMDCGNMGGFRYRGKVTKFNFEYIILTSSLTEPEWPDSLDRETGLFIYYGDNRTPGSVLHTTKKRGNQILRWMFDQLHTGELKEIPPIFVFTKAGSGRDYSFVGLAVPGAKGMATTEDLIALWKTSNAKRFQNYKATFTILDVPKISRKWINDLKTGNPFSKNCPHVWKQWVETRKYTPLQSEPSVKYRSKSEQLPEDSFGKEVCNALQDKWKENPQGFEKCAAEIFKLLDQNVIEYTLTRPWKDGGRDATGEYRIGTESHNIRVEFALEAKLYAPKNGVSVRDTSRLISRLRHRQFGVLVTTSYVSLQAYKEIIEDGHPVVIIAGRDIAEILRSTGHKSIEQVSKWNDSL